MERSALVPDFHDHKAGQLVELHAHAEGQVLLAAEGDMTVWIGETRFELAPRTGIWVPPCVPHAARSREDTAFRGVMLDVPRSSDLPARAARFAASPLFLAAATGLVDARAANRTRASELLFDGLVSHLAPQRGPYVPDDPRLAELCAMVVGDPADAPSLDAAAKFVRMSRRSFTRCFRAATGLAWGEWVREARLAEAAALLAAGARVTDAALAVGYATPSAFSYAFRRDRGKAPVRLRA